MKLFCNSMKLRFVSVCLMGLAVGPAFAEDATSSVATTPTLTMERDLQAAFASLQAHGLLGDVHQASDAAIEAAARTVDPDARLYSVAEAEAWTTRCAGVVD